MTPYYQDDLVTISDQRAKGLSHHEALDVVLDVFFDTPGPHSLDDFRRDLHTILDAAVPDLDDAR